MGAQLPAIPMAVEQGLPVIFLVMNNRAHGTIADLQASNFGRSYGCEFTDPDGNGWLLQEVKERAPGRVTAVKPDSLGVAELSALLRETETHHGAYEATAPKHHWSAWYAGYMVARLHGRSPEEAAKDAALAVPAAAA